MNLMYTVDEPNSSSSECLGYHVPLIDANLSTSTCLFFMIFLFHFPIFNFPVRRRLGRGAGAHAGSGGKCPGHGPGQRDQTPAGTSDQ